MILRFLPSFASLFCLLTGSTTIWAQGATTIRFDGLPPNQHLGEQFASQGIHFVSIPGNPQAPPATVLAPPTLHPSQNTVAVGSYFRMHFDLPISAFRATIAELPLAGGEPNYLMAADRLIIGGFPAGQWSTASASFPASSALQDIDLFGYRFVNAENLSSSIYVDSLEFTTIPEPQTFWLLTLGLGAVLLRRSKTLKTRSG